ncbi:small ribosomal subunit protein uS9m [Neocloeon triangulifer]|uniref:small ribosomal subunit protein uS9m n=1 Tax=Neocloeon triangulifer TaxID=2078957 RepID=UPI00286F599E|nr:small ribosomal subunit protein uS9m [Neocloeon triangulifer]
MGTAMLPKHRVFSLISCSRTLSRAQSLAQNKFHGSNVGCRTLNTLSAQEAILEIKNMPDETKPASAKKPISKAMKAYLLRAKSYDEFMKKQIVEYQIGRRHLANIMSMDADTMTQEDIDQAIEFLFPSSLFEPKARPIMKPPELIFPPKKAAEFDETGRPHHALFYTMNPNFYQVLQDSVTELIKLNKEEDEMIRKKMTIDNDLKLSLSGTEWIQKEKLSAMLIEKIDDAQYEQFQNVLIRLADHPLSSKVKDFVMKYRYSLVNEAALAEIPKPLYEKDGRSYITFKGARRKNAYADVTVHLPGSGKFSVNGQDIEYFSDIQSREQITFPLIFTAMLGKVDINATAIQGGPTGQAGAIRFGLAMALRSFVDNKMVERMRLAGLLQVDWRTRERKKPGQPGARRKPTWKAR